MIFKEIDIDSYKELRPFFNSVDYEACEYCFTTLYMWRDMYKTSYYIEDDFAIIVGEYEGDRFSVLPLAKKDKIHKAIAFMINYFKNEDHRIYLRAVTKEVVELLQKDYPGRFEYIEERDYFDYVYDAESLRTLKGRKNQKKRNHLNYFIKEYEGRVEYKKLDKENFDDCITLLKAWTVNKEEHGDKEEGIDDEFVAIKKIFDHYDILREDVKISGIYIDNKLEAFTIGEKINEHMAVIHIEKANPEIRGLYPYINQQFLVNEFPDVELVNREEDLGLEGLRKAKLSYHPCKFVEKYTVTEA
ncbi:phosphatidylglycerol lysyltransferase domain-containing protein [Paraclostridium sordellii]